MEIVFYDVRLPPRVIGDKDVSEAERRKGGESGDAVWFGGEKARGSAGGDAVVKCLPKWMEGACKKIFGDKQMEDLDMT